MNNAIAFPLKHDDVNDHAQARLDLPAPRIWTPKHLAEFLGVSVHWVYKRTEAAAEDPIPRVKDMRLLRFDTHALAFQAWMRRRLDYVDSGGGDE